MGNEAVKDSSPEQEDADIGCLLDDGFTLIDGDTRQLTASEISALFQAKYGKALAEQELQTAWVDDFAGKDDDDNLENSVGGMNTNEAEAATTFNLHDSADDFTCTVREGAEVFHGISTSADGNKTVLYEPS